MIYFILFNIMYAGDTSVLFSGNNLNDFICLLNKEVDLLYIWLKSNKLSFNTQNTSYHPFHRARLKGHNLFVKMNYYTLNRVTNCL